MRYNIAKMTLPHHRRYNIRAVWWRAHKRHALLVVYALLLGVMIEVGEAYLVELNNRLASEGAHLSLIGDVWRLTHFGSPGTLTDYQEHTNAMGNLGVVK